MEVRFGQLKNIFFQPAEKMPSRKKLYLLKLKDDGKKRKIVVNIEFTPLPHCNMLPF